MEITPAMSTFLNLHAEIRMIVYEILFRYLTVYDPKCACFAGLKSTNKPLVFSLLQTCQLCYRQGTLSKHQFGCFMFAPDSFKEIVHGRSSPVLMHLAMQLQHVAMHDGVFSTGFLTDVAPRFHNLRTLTLITCAFFYRATAAIDSEDSYSSQHCARITGDAYGFASGGATHQLSSSRPR